MSSAERDANTSRVIAIPVTGGQLCDHFGHCEWFALFDVDAAGDQILNTRQLDPPAHEPSVLPRWLHSQGVNVVIAGGMGQRAQSLFAEHGIEVHVGAPAERAETIVQDYLDGKLRFGENICDH